MNGTLGSCDGNILSQSTFLTPSPAAYQSPPPPYRKNATGPTPPVRVKSPLPPVNTGPPLQIRIPEDQRPKPLNFLPYPSYGEVTSDPDLCPGAAAIPQHRHQPQATTAPLSIDQQLQLQLQLQYQYQLQQRLRRHQQKGQATKAPLLTIQQKHLLTLRLKLQKDQRFREKALRAAEQDVFETTGEHPCDPHRRLRCAFIRRLKQRSMLSTVWPGSRRLDAFVQAEVTMMMAANNRDGDSSGSDSGRSSRSSSRSSSNNSSQRDEHADVHRVRMRDELVRQLFEPVPWGVELWRLARTVPVADIGKRSVMIWRLLVESLAQTRLALEEARKKEQGTAIEARGSERREKELGRMKDELNKDRAAIGSKFMELERGWRKISIS